MTSPCIDPQFDEFKPLLVYCPSKQSVYSRITHSRLILKPFLLQQFRYHGVKERSFSIGGVIPRKLVPGEAPINE